MGKDITEDPFDFPMAYCWRGYYEETHYGRKLPHIDIQQKPPQYIEHIHHNVNDTRRVFAKLNALDGAIKYLLKEKDKQKGGKKKSQSGSLKNILILDKGGGEEGSI